MTPDATATRARPGWTARWRQRLVVPLLLLPGLGVIVGFIGLVAYFAVAQSLGRYSFTAEDAWTLDYWRRLSDDPTFWRAFRYSARIATVSAIGAVAIAYPLALWLRQPFPGSTLAGGILKIPLLVPGLVAAFLLVNFISFNGLLNHTLQLLGITDEPLPLQNDRWAISVMFLQLWKQMPFALLLLTGAVRGINPDVLLAARDAGSGPWSRFVHIVAPLTLSSMQAALIIIFIGAAGDFSFQVIAGPRSPQSVAQYMYVNRSVLGDQNYAAVIGVMLMSLSLVGSLLVAGVARLVVNRRSYL